MHVLLKRRNATSLPGPPALPGDSLAQPSVYDPEFLRRQARWIRDELDPQIARDGRDALHSDHILRIDEFLRRLLIANISLKDLRYSRVHLAIKDIAGLATRWPDRLIERGEALQKAWESSYGPLEHIGILLYEPGGRLHGVCKPEDLSKEKLTVMWLKSPTVKFSPLVARRFGDLGFTPGDWWINPLFAFRAGIIDSSESEGRIVADASGAYAVFMTGSDEIAGTSPEAFTYRAKDDDKGRYRLTAGTPESRQPVRIIRSYSLRSLCTPKAGLRYDGLHKVTSWSIVTEPKTKSVTYDISFKRLPSERNMDEVLRRPWTEEIEDYKEATRLRHLARDKLNKAKKNEMLLAVARPGDGAVDVFEDETAETPFQSSFTDKVPVDLGSSRTPLADATPRHDSALPAEVE
ncbi:hypothetical protein LTR36_006247 [Oleoguttula mirabilis]|uniref:YDG domain-containing protein n=1 Tax=Oleoguttula mirabilis TaxID=1507867 RepID=A0AAV9JC69_9PEZI|nr:hypothetical protein LTR36_006247 [Oleoguttula mirabilis]